MLIVNVFDKQQRRVGLPRDVLLREGNGGGVLVNVPDPARFALHKLIVSGERTVTMRAKREKDIRQAGQVLDVLLDDRPGDLRVAWDEIRERGAGWERRVRKGMAALGTLFPKIAERLRSLL